MWFSGRNNFLWPSCVWKNKNRNPGTSCGLKTHQNSCRWKYACVNATKITYYSYSLEHTFSSVVVWSMYVCVHVYIGVLKNRAVPVHQRSHAVGLLIWWALKAPKSHGAEPEHWTQSKKVCGYRTESFKHWDWRLRWISVFLCCQCL